MKVASRIFIGLGAVLLVLAAALYFGEQATLLVIGASVLLLLIYFGIRFRRSLQFKVEETTSTFVEAGEESRAEPLSPAQNIASETATSVELDNEQAAGKKAMLPVALLAITGWIAGVLAILLYYFSLSYSRGHITSLSQFTLPYIYVLSILGFGTPGAVIGGLVGGRIGRPSQLQGAAIGGVVGVIPFVLCTTIM